MKAGKATDLFPDSYRGDPIRPVRHNWPPKTEIPVISNIAPPQSNKEIVSVNIIGTGFTRDCLVLFNNAAIPSICVSETKITADFARTATGTFDVKVRGAIGDSDPKSFTFN